MEITKVVSDGHMPIVTISGLSEPLVLDTSQKVKDFVAELKKLSHPQLPIEEPGRWSILWRKKNKERTVENNKPFTLFNAEGWGGN